MIVQNLDNIIRKENFIYYRREFTATAKYEFTGTVKTGLIEFVIETAPTGKKEVTIKLIDSIDYPLLPIVQKLKEVISNLDKEGKLP